MYNRFRSKVAEAMFLHYCKNKKIEVKSAGMRTDFLHLHMAKQVIDILNAKGIKALDNGSRLVDEGLINWADKIVVVADNVSPEIFPAKKVLQWSVPDASEHDRTATLASMKMIEEEIKRFVKIYIEE